MALTKEKLISRLQTQVGLSKQESRSVVERILDIMKESLAVGEDLLISGFGKFSVRQKNARRGRNPQTKENLMLRARKVVVFKTSGVLRNRTPKASNPLSLPHPQPCLKNLRLTLRPIRFGGQHPFADTKDWLYVARSGGQGRPGA
jgi:integration host factor subunit alpha